MRRMDESQDAAALSAQLGRPLRAPACVRRRCDLELPIVTEVPPRLESGEPFPTRYWLSCPLAHRRIARLESAGGVKAADARAANEPEFREALDAAHRRYAAERDALLDDGEGPRPSGGVAGARGGVKCLHAHYADLAAGNDNPVGAAIEAVVEPLRCPLPCVIPSEGSFVRNPAWREPKP